MVLGTDSEAHFSFLEINLETGEQISTIAPPFSTQFIWDSEANTVLVAHLEQISLVDLKSECVFLQIPRRYDERLSNHSSYPPSYFYSKETRFLFNSSYEVIELTFEALDNEKQSCSQIDNQ